MKYINFLTLLFIIVGGINWGLYTFGGNLVYTIFGSIPALEKLIYILVALSAVYQIKNLSSSLK